MPILLEITDVTCAKQSSISHTKPAGSLLVHQRITVEQLLQCMTGNQTAQKLCILLVFI